MAFFFIIVHCWHVANSTRVGAGCNIVHEARSAAKMERAARVCFVRCACVGARVMRACNSLHVCVCRTDATPEHDAPPQGRVGAAHHARPFMSSLSSRYYLVALRISGDRLLIGPDGAGHEEGMPASRMAHHALKIFTSVITHMRI